MRHRQIIPEEVAETLAQLFVFKLCRRANFVDEWCGVEVLGYMVLPYRIEYFHCFVPMLVLIAAKCSAVPGILALLLICTLLNDPIEEFLSGTKLTHTRAECVLGI